MKKKVEEVEEMEWRRRQGGRGEARGGVGGLVLELGWRNREKGEIERRTEEEGEGLKR